MCVLLFSTVVFVFHNLLFSTAVLVFRNLSSERLCCTVYFVFFQLLFVILPSFKTRINECCCCCCYITVYCCRYSNSIISYSYRYQLYYTVIIILSISFLSAVQLRDQQKASVPSYRYMKTSLNLQTTICIAIYQFTVPVTR